MTDEEEASFNPMKSRDAYKKERLEKVKNMRSTPDQTAAPTMEELKSKPSIREIKMRPLV